MNATPKRPGPLMVVDDDRLVLLTLAHGLRQSGYEVVEADNGDDAILLARRVQPCLAVLDIRMQGLSGFDVAQYLKDYSRTPFLFLSAFTDQGVLSQAKALGALACLSKPVELSVLLRAIESALATGSGLADPPVAAPSPATRDEPDLWPVAALAAGLLMARHGWDRQVAQARLQALAQSQGRRVEDVAEDLLKAQEVLNRAALTPR